MYSTMSHIKELTGMKPEERKVYFIYSVPPFSSCKPFGLFALTRNETLNAYDKEGIVMMGCNTVLIMSPTRLRRPRVRV